MHAEHMQHGVTRAAGVTRVRDSQRNVTGTLQNYDKDNAVLCCKHWSPDSTLRRQTRPEARPLGVTLTFIYPIHFIQPERYDSKLYIAVRLSSA